MSSVHPEPIEHRFVATVLITIAVARVGDLDEHPSELTSAVTAQA
jgi:hypothetical protein